jgi:RNA polymerase sigma-70 factor (ECF subfamily)
MAAVWTWNDSQLGMAAAVKPQPRVEGDEERLWAAVADGDRAAAERLVERTYGLIYGALFRLAAGDAELAADLTQETYRKAWSALAGFDGRSRFSTWLFRIAYTTFLNHIRRPRRVVTVEDLERTAAHAGAGRDPDPAADELLVHAHDDERVRRAVLALPEELRFTISARYWGELPVEEIARQAGVGGPAIRKRLRKALALLARELESDEPA